MQERTLAHLAATIYLLFSRIGKWYLVPITYIAYANIPSYEALDS